MTHNHRFIFNKETRTILLHNLTVHLRHEITNLITTLITLLRRVSKTLWHIRINRKTLHQLAAHALNQCLQTHKTRDHSSWLARQATALKTSCLLRFRWTRCHCKMRIRYLQWIRCKPSVISKTARQTTKIHFTRWVWLTLPLPKL